MNIPTRMIKRVTVLLSLFVLQAQAVEGTWITNGNGDWNDPDNWLEGVIPNGVGHVANLTAALTAARTISLQGDITLGVLNIANEEYLIGASTVTTPEIIMNNGNEPARLTIVNLNNRNQLTRFRHPIRVVNRLVADLTGSNDRNVEFYSGFVGGTDAHLDLTYELTGSNRIIDLRANQGFLGTVDLRRRGFAEPYRQIRFHDNNGIFAGGAASIRVHQGVTLEFRGALTDAMAERFAFVDAENSILIGSSGTLSALTDAAALMPIGGVIFLNHDTTTVIQRVPAGQAFPLNNTQVRLTGFNTSPGRVNEEFPGTLKVESGANRIWIENRNHADSVAGMHFDGFLRSGTATLTLRGSGRGGDPLGSTESNRVTVASGLPAEVNGILPPYIVHFSHANGYGINGLFVRVGEHGLTPFEAYDAVNDFSLGANAVVEVTEAQNLGGGSAEVYALRAREAITNGDLTIHSGGLILGNPHKDYSANFYFGAGGMSDAYIHLDGHNTSIHNNRFTGSIHCRDVVLFGAGDIDLRAENKISGKIDLQLGRLIIRHPLALGSETDVVMGFDTRFELASATVGEYAAGGLRSPGRATIRANGTANERLVIHPAATTEHLFRGRLTDEAGTLGVTVAGAGVQIFDGVSDYTGDTIIEDGATLLLGTNGVLGTSTVVVTNGATFGGTGRTAGALVLDDGARLNVSPGSPLRVEALHVGASSRVTIDISDCSAFLEGPVLIWSGDAPESSPRLDLVGAPVSVRGTYGAVYEEADRQIAVRLVFPHPLTIIIR